MTRRPPPSGHRPPSTSIPPLRFRRADPRVAGRYWGTRFTGRLLLNANPDPDGLVPEADFARYVEFGKEIRRRFAGPLAGTKGEGPVVELVLPNPSRVDHVVVMEDIAHGERVRSYEVEGLLPGGEWKKLCDGISVGHKRIQQFPPEEVVKVRFKATQFVAEPKIRWLGVYGVA